MNILAALARESLLSERVISMEADGASSGLPAVNPELPQNTTPSSQMGPGAKDNPAGGKVGSNDANNVVRGDGDLNPKEDKPAKDIKRLLVEAGYFGVCALKNTMESLAEQGDYVQSEYGDDKAKRVTEMVQALEEMKTMLSEMYDAKGGDNVQAPAQQNTAPSQPVDTAGQGAGAPQAVPAVDVKEKPEA